MAGLKPAMINVTATKPVRLNMSPAPATTGVNVATSFIVLAQDLSSPANSGPSSTTINLSSTTSTMEFSADGSTGWGSSLSLALVDGRAIFYALDISPTGAAGATITATDLAGTGPLKTGVTNVYIYQAALKILSSTVQWPNVTQGESGIGVTLTVQNSGGISATLNLSSSKTFPTFNGSSANYTAVSWPGNPTSIAAGATVQLYYTVAVGAAAPVGTVVVNGQVTGTDDQSGGTLSDVGFSAITQSWVVANSTATQILVRRSTGTPQAGAPFAVSVTVMDAGNRTVTAFATGVTLSTRLVASPLVTATGQVNLLYPALTRGISYFNSSYNQVEGVFLRGDAGSLTGFSLGITPTAAAFNHYSVSEPAGVIAGAPFAVTVAAVDAYGNVTLGAAAVTVTARLTSTGGLGSAVPAVTGFNTSAGAASTASEAYTRAGNPAAGGVRRERFCVPDLSDPGPDRGAGCPFALQHRLPCHRRGGGGLPPDPDRHGRLRQHPLRRRHRQPDGQWRFGHPECAVVEPQQRPGVDQQRDLQPARHHQDQGLRRQHHQRAGPDFVDCLQRADGDAQLHAYAHAGLFGHPEHHPDLDPDRDAFQHHAIDHTQRDAQHHAIDYA